MRKILRLHTTATEFHYGEHGKPGLDGVEFNLSHSGEFALIAVSLAAAVGVDIERVRDRVDIARLLARIGEKDLPEGRTALFARWTQREAMSKAVGGPLFIPPGAEIGVTHVAAPEGYAASVALVGFEPECRFQNFEALENLGV